MGASVSCLVNVLTTGRKERGLRGASSSSSRVRFLFEARVGEISIHDDSSITGTRGKPVKIVAKRG